MVGIEVVVVLTVALLLLGIVELWVHGRRLRTIRYRIHVNGTRGKSSVTRLIAAGLREGGMRACAKTTGSTARMILPDGRELPIYRPAGPNIIEQKRIVAVAAAHGAEALVIECMALQPALQALCELKLLKATHSVVTNVRPDHLDVMGPSDRDVALAMAGMTPVGGKLYTAERGHVAVLEAAAKDRRSALMRIDQELDQALLEGFHYTEHGANVALALAVCADLGVEPAVALAGMKKARPDPGALTESVVNFFGRRMVFVNGFAANDAVSTEQVWSLANHRHRDMKRRIAVFNCRADRPDRSVLLGRAFARWEPADYVVLMGSGTHLFAEAAARSGVDGATLVIAEGWSTPQVFERIVALSGESALVMGMGNIAHGGLQLVSYFANRALPVSPLVEPAPIPLLAGGDDA
jgi:poly-gamma-glutamate synthase PgsB/CapB